MKGYISSKGKGSISVTVPKSSLSIVLESTPYHKSKPQNSSLVYFNVTTNKNNIHNIVYKVTGTGL